MIRADQADRRRDMREGGNAPVLPHAMRVVVDQHRYTLAALCLIVFGAGLGGGIIVVSPRALLPILALLAGAGALAAAYWFPGFIFAAYVSTPFYKAALQPHLPIDITVVLAFLAMLQIPILLSSVGRPRTPIAITGHVRRALLIWLGLCLLIVFGVAYAPNMDWAMTAARDWVILTFLPILGMLRLTTDRRYMRQFLWGLVVMGAVVSMTGMWLLPQVGAWPNDRLRVFGAHTIRVGQAALLLPIVSVSFVLRSANPLLRLVSFGLIPFAMIVALSSGARGPLLMLAICCLVFSARRFILWKTRADDQPSLIAPLRVIVPGIILLLTIVLLPMSSVGSFIPQTSATRIESLSTIISGVANQDLSDEAPDDSTDGRLIAYQFAVRLIKESPIIGQGTTGFAALVPVKEHRLLWPEPIGHPHNLVLEMAAEHGMVGLLILTLMTVVALRRGFRLGNDPEWNTVLILFVFFLLGAMVSTEMLDNRFMWAVAFLLLVAPDPALSPTADDTARHRIRHTPESATQAQGVVP